MENTLYYTHTKIPRKHADLKKGQQTFRVMMQKKCLGFQNFKKPLQKKEKFGISKIHGTGTRVFSKYTTKQCILRIHGTGTGTNFSEVQQPGTWQKAPKLNNVQNSINRYFVKEG